MYMYNRKFFILGWYWIKKKKENYSVKSTLLGTIEGRKPNLLVTLVNILKCVKLSDYFLLAKLIYSWRLYWLGMHNSTWMWLITWQITLNIKIFILCHSSILVTVSYLYTCIWKLQSFLCDIVCFFLSDSFGKDAPIIYFLLIKEQKFYWRS